MAELRPKLHTRKECTQFSWMLGGDLRLEEDVEVTLVVVISDVFTGEVVAGRAQMREGRQVRVMMAGMEKRMMLVDRGTLRLRCLLERRRLGLDVTQKGLR